MEQSPGCVRGTLGGVRIPSTFYSIIFQVVFICTWTTSLVLASTSTTPSGGLGEAIYKCTARIGTDSIIASPSSWEVRYVWKIYNLTGVQLTQPYKRWCIAITTLRHTVYILTRRGITQLPRFPSVESVAKRRICLRSSSAVNLGMFDHYPLWAPFLLLKVR